MLMEVNLADIKPELHGELKELVGVMVFQYFSRYSSTEALRTENRITSILAGNNPLESGLDYSESAELSMQVAMLLIAITRHHLPNFQSHRSEDCVGILNITMRGTVAHLEIDPQAYQYFVTYPGS